MNAAVFLDRDNTIIHNDGDLGDPEGVKLIQGAASAIASLRGLNYKIIVVTNQGGVARGKYGEEDVQKTNQRVADMVRMASGAIIDRFYYCPYHPQGTVPEYTREHDWRKPAPGMLIQAAKDLQIDLSQSWMVGDQMRDVQAGVAAGTRAILLRADAQELQPLRGDQIKSGRVEVTGEAPHFIARNMVEAVRIIAQQRKPEADMPAAATGEPLRKKWDPAAVRAAREAKAGDAAAAAPAAPPVITPSPASTASPATPTPAPTRTATPPTSTPPASPPAAVVPPARSLDTSPDSKPSADDLQSMVEADDAASTGPRVPPADVTLRQILQELRGQRQVHSDFSYLRMVAVVMQIVAGFLLVAGLLLGADDAMVFFRWLATAILIQLATLAILMFAR